MNKKKRRGIGKIRGFTIQFLPYVEILHLNSTERIRKILNIVLGNNILILQGKLKAEEEARLIGDTMAMIDHVKGFKGIELAVISGNGDNQGGFFSRIRQNLANSLAKGELGAVTIIGPATIVKDIKKNPKKIELFLNR